MTAQLWYYLIDQEQQPPVTFEELQQLATDGMLAPTDLVWTQGMGVWLEAGKIKKLFPSGVPQAKPTSTKPAATPAQPVPNQEQTLGRRRRRGIGSSESSPETRTSRSQSSRTGENAEEKSIPWDDVSKDQEERPKRRESQSRGRRPISKNGRNNKALVIAGVAGGTLFFLLLGVVVLFMSLSSGQPKAKQQAGGANNPNNTNNGKNSPNDAAKVAVQEIALNKGSGVVEDGLARKQLRDYQVTLRANKQYFVSVSSTSRLDPKFEWGLSSDFDNTYPPPPLGPTAKSYALLTPSKTDKYRFRVGGDPSQEGDFRFAVALYEKKDLVWNKDIAEIKGLLLPGQDSVYKLRMPSGARYTVDLVSTNFDAYLEMTSTDKSDSNTYRDDHSGPGRNARITLTPKKGGEYCIVARDRNRRGRGKFTLRIEKEVFPILALDEQNTVEVKGRIRNGKWMYHYAHLEKGVRYLIDLKSKEIDSWIEVRSLEGRQLAYDDNNGGGRDARVVFVPQETKKYFIAAVARPSTPNGNWTLKVTKETFQLLSLKGGKALVQGKVSPRWVQSYEIPLKTGESYDFYLKPTSGKRLTLTVGAKDEPVKTLLNRTSGYRSTDTIRLGFDPKKTGNYLLRLGGEKGGSFRLRVVQDVPTKLAFGKDGKFTTTNKYADKPEKSYSVRLEKDSLYNFIAAGHNGDYLEVLPPIGVELPKALSAQRGGRSQLTFVPTKGGDYRIRVKNRWNRMKQPFVFSGTREVLHEVALKNKKGEVTFSLPPRGTKAVLVPLVAKKRYDVVLEHEPNEMATMWIYAEDLSRSIFHRDISPRSKSPAYMLVTTEHTAKHVLRVKSDGGGNYKLRVSPHPVRKLSLDKSGKAKTEGDYTDAPERTHSIRLEKDVWYDLELDTNGVRSYLHVYHKGRRIQTGSTSGKETAHVTFAPQATDDYEIRAVHSDQHCEGKFILRAQKKKIPAIVFGAGGEAKFASKIDRRATHVMSVDLKAGTTYELSLTNKGPFRLSATVSDASVPHRILYRATSQRIGRPKKVVRVTPIRSSKYLIVVDGGLGGDYALTIQKEEMEERSKEEGRKTSRGGAEE